MKIGFDAKSAFVNFTGLGSYCKYVIRVLNENYPENKYLLYTPKVSNKKEIKALIKPSHTEIRTPAKIISRMNLGNIWRSTILGNTALSDGVDIFHGLGNELPIISNKRLKTVVTIHDLMFVRYPQMFKPVDIEILKRRYKHACKVANRIIAISQQTADDITNFLGVDPRKINVVYPGCPSGFHKEYDPIELKKIIDKYRLPEDFILNVGTVEPRRNALLIVKALAILKDKLDMPLVILGKPNRKYKDEIIRVSNKERIANRIEFLHKVPAEDLPKIYQLSKLFVYPSLFEGFGIPIVEALCSKVPVIASKGFSFAEAGGPKSIYIDNNDPEELANVIMKLLNNSQLAGKMIVHGEEYVKRFGDRKISSELMKVYQEAVSG